MKTDNGRSVSVWMSGVEARDESPALRRDERADVCVVGAGIAGLSTAYLLAREGKKVVVLDDGPTAGGETCRTTAHLASYMDDSFAHLLDMHGEEVLRLHVESHAAAVDQIERIVRDEKIECDFKRVDGYLYASPDGLKEDFLQREQEIARQIGFSGVEWVIQAPIGGFDTGRCLRFPRQGRFHPLKYFSALADRITRLGGQIYNGVHASEIAGGSPAKVATAGGQTITADAVVVATNTPVNDLVAIHTKQMPYRTYVVAVRVPRGSVGDALYWDTEDPYHYIRLQETGQNYDLLIVGGEDHKTGHQNDATQRWKRLDEWTCAHFKMTQAIEFHWSGQVMEPVDCLAYIGRNPLDKDNVFIATGDSGQGMTHGTIAGMLLRDLIMGRANPWEKMYDPSRKPVHSAMEYVKENLAVAAQYADYVTGGDVKSESQIAAGQGAVIRRGLTKVAIYRDYDGALHECSAVCPHVGCIVQWNGGEGSWDCPCHGSRFDPYGRVVNGPANSDLQRHSH